MTGYSPLVAKPARLPFLTQLLIKWSTTRLPMFIVPSSSMKAIWTCGAIVANEVGGEGGKDRTILIIRDPNPAFSKIGRLHSRVATEGENRLLEASSHWVGACYNYICKDSSRTGLFFAATQLLRLIPFACSELQRGKTGGIGPLASRRAA